MTAKEEGDSSRSSWAISHPTKQIASRGPIQGRQGLHIPLRLATRHETLRFLKSWRKQRSARPLQRSCKNGRGPCADGQLPLSFSVQRVCVSALPLLSTMCQRKCVILTRGRHLRVSRETEGGGGRKRDRQGKREGEKVRCQFQKVDLTVIPFAL